MYSEKIDAATGTASEIVMLYPEKSTLESRFFDSMGNVTGVLTANNRYDALHNEKGLRYLDGAYLQRNEAGLVVRVTQKNGGAGAESGYEYFFDSRGNWTERRETKLTEAAGLLLPSAGDTVKRAIEY